jgi:hypothetical protein
MTKTNDRKPRLSRLERNKQRRALLKKLGRFGVVTAPTVTLLLAAQTKPGQALPPSASCAPSSRAFKISEAPVNVASVLVGVTALPIRVLAGT